MKGKSLYFHCKRPHINSFNGDRDIAQNVKLVSTLKVQPAVMAAIYAKSRISEDKFWEVIELALIWCGLF